VFARRLGSVAAPTAALHFTKRLVQKLKNAGFGVEFVTLHVGLGTFAPLTEAQVKTHKLHAEYYEVESATARALAQARKQGRPIVAVGTTVARTLEAVATSGKRTGETKLFIHPGYKFKMVDALITNFHVPSSSLLMLVAALVGKARLFKLYALAQKRGYRFFSFGDGMLIT
jgi:S-adenosylmethionine:tRNA ribosyltransferase-isomerase